MYVVAGLGNPGRRYEGTRHNMGFETVDILSRKTGIPVGTDKMRALMGTGFVGNEKVILVKPQTYMNLSGTAVAPIVKFYKADPAGQLIVVSDDIDLPAGHLRIRKSGSAGGHNGLKDLIACLGTQDFIRVRIGVGRKPEGWDLADYVLSRFTPAEQRCIDEAEAAAAEAVLMIMKEGVDAAMNRYNAFRPSSEAR